MELQPLADVIALVLDDTDQSHPVATIRQRDNAGPLTAFEWLAAVSNSLQSSSNCLSKPQGSGLECMQ
jgi:hypothetical protein